MTSDFQVWDFVFVFKLLVLRSILVLLKIGSSGIRCEFREDVLKSILLTLRFHSFNGVNIDSSLHYFLSEQHLLPLKMTTSQKPVSHLNVSNSPLIPTIWEGMHYTKPWVYYLAPEIHKTVFRIWSLFIYIIACLRPSYKFSDNYYSSSGFRVSDKGTQSRE